MQHIFIVNTISGKHKRALSLLKLLKDMKNVLPEIKVFNPASQHEAFDFVKNFDCSSEPARFYACGGDGTLHVIANSIYNKSNCELSCVPVGTGNDFIKSFGYTSSEVSREWLERLIKSNAKEIDVIQYGAEIALNICSVGFDAKVCLTKEKLSKLPLVGGSFAYNLSVFASLIGKLGNKFKISVDGEKPKIVPLLLLLCGNGIYYGGGFKAAPYADLCDGMLEVVSFDSVSQLEVARLMKFFRAGTHIEELAICHYRRGKKIEIFSEKPFAINGDGECYSARSVTFEAVPSAIKFAFCN
jgi:diacylglycerol kinase (ATP)